MPEQRVIPMFSYEDVGRARRGLDRGGLRLHGDRSLVRRRRKSQDVRAAALASLTGARHGYARVTRTCRLPQLPARRDSSGGRTGARHGYASVTRACRL